MRVGWLLCLIGFGCGSGALPEVTRTAGEIQDGAEDRVRKARTVQVRFSAASSDGATSLTGRLAIDGEDKAFLLLEGSLAGRPFTLTRICDGKTARTACSLFPGPSTVPAPPKIREDFLDQWLGSGILGLLPKLSVETPGEGPKKPTDPLSGLSRERGPNEVVDGRERVSVQYLLDGMPTLTRWYDRLSGLPVQRDMRMPKSLKPDWTESYLNVRLDEAIEPAAFTVPKD